jgi:hypothetical protein
VDEARAPEAHTGPSVGPATAGKNTMDGDFGNLGIIPSRNPGLSGSHGFVLQVEAIIPIEFIRLVGIDTLRARA